MASLPVTQMYILPIPTSKTIEDASSEDGKSWEMVLHILRGEPGYQNLYWGRQVETPNFVQLHIVRATMTQHRDFLLSVSCRDMNKLLSNLMNGPPSIRHASIKHYTAGNQGLGGGSPVTGTAIYEGLHDDWDQALEHWVSIVQHVPGFMGFAAGRMIDTVDGFEKACIVYVGWESVKAHEDYHHTQHFAERRRILLDPTDRYNYYGHVAFRNSERKVGVISKL